MNIEHSAELCSVGRSGSRQQAARGVRRGVHRRNLLDLVSVQRLMPALLLVPTAPR